MSVRRMTGNISSTSVNAPVLARGEYQAPGKTDVRGPCPVLNSLANHGYIKRSGCSITSAEMYAAMKEIGVGISINMPFCYGAYLEYHANPPKSWWTIFTSPFAYIMRKTAMRPPGQMDANGIPVLNLDQLAIPGQVEHDVSLSRRDFAQGDNLTKQDDLVADLIASSSDGRMMTSKDWARVRQTRLEQQKNDNPKLNFPSGGLTVAAAEIALIQTVFGLSDKAFDVPVPYIKAIFDEERLPIQEGWRKRPWWGYVGAIELIRQSKVMGSYIGSD